MERTKERIKLETEMLRFIVVAMVALGGETISTLGLNLATWQQYRRITRLIERLPEEKP